MIVVKSLPNLTKLTRNGRSYTSDDVPAKNKQNILNSQLSLQQHRVNAMQERIADTTAKIRDNSDFLKVTSSIPSIRRMYRLELLQREEAQQTLKVDLAHLTETLTVSLKAIERLEKQISSLTQ